MTRLPLYRAGWLTPVLLAWLGVVLLRSTGIGGDWRPVGLFSWLVLSIWVAAYALGHSLAKPRRRAQAIKPFVPATRWFARWIHGLSFAAVIGAALITYEFAITRGYGFSTSVALIRIAEVDSALDGFGGSWISGIGRLLTPSLQVAWMLAVLCEQRLSRRAWSFLIAATLIVLWQQTMFEGGRFFLAGLVVACMVARQMRPRGDVASSMPGKRRSHWVVGAVLGVSVTLLFGYVFIDRVRSLDVDLSDGYATFVTSFAIDVSSQTLQRLHGDGSGPLFSLYMFWMYISQGPNEFDRLLDHRSLEHAFGMVQFAQVGQGLTKLTGLNFTYDQFANMPNPGTYTTMVGPNYMDFGVVLAWLLALVLGYLTAFSTRRLGRGRLDKSGLTAPLLVTVGLFSPIVSLLVNLWPALILAWYVGATAHPRRARRRSARAPSPT